MQRQILVTHTCNRHTLASRGLFSSFKGMSWSAKHQLISSQKGDKINHQKPLTSFLKPYIKTDSFQPFPAVCVILMFASPQSTGYMLLWRLQNSNRPQKVTKWATKNRSWDHMLKQKNRKQIVFSLFQLLAPSCSLPASNFSVWSICLLHLAACQPSQHRLYAFVTPPKQQNTT